MYEDFPRFQFEKKFRKKLYYNDPLISIPSIETIKLQICQAKQYYNVNSDALKQKHYDPL